MIFKILKLFLIFYLINISESNSFEYHIEDKDVYLISTILSTWMGAKTSCDSNFMELISIPNLYTNEIIEKYMKLYKMTQMWTSGNKLSGVFKWGLSSQTFNDMGYTNWVANHPVATVGSNFVYVGSANAYMWINGPETNLFGFGCVTSLEKFTANKLFELKNNENGTYGNNFQFVGNAKLTQLN